MKIVIYLVFGLMVACTSIPVNNQVDAFSLAIHDVSEQLDILEKQGFLNSNQESSIQLELAYAHSLLLNHGAPLLNTNHCKGAVTRLGCAEMILIQANKLLVEIEP